MRYSVLGSMRVLGVGGEVRLHHRLQVVLAVLLCRAGETVPIDQLVDAVWGDSPPRTARKNIQLHIHQLRRITGDGGLVSRVRGYALEVAPSDLDARSFEDGLRRADTALAERQLAAGRGHLVRALARWRGPAYESLTEVPAVREEAARLTELRLTAVEKRFDADLALGDHAAVVAELAAFVADQPWRERPAAQLMVALYRCGRRSDALAVYDRARRALVGELGIEPGAHLQELHRAVLAGDRSLDPPDRGAPAPAPDHGAAVRAPDRGAPAPAKGAPAQLPADVAGFTGRAEALARLDELVARSNCPSVVVVHGTAGAGKTALAVHWAHRAAGEFPDGQLYVNLRGFDPGNRPCTPEQVVRGFLGALGVPPERVPPSFDDQVGLYRSQVAGRRILVVLDNARDAEHVRPLLPGAPTALTLVTSRNQLLGLVATQGAYPLALGLLPAPDARRMLARRLGDQRVADEPAAADAIVAACARLPLALAVAAARARQGDHPLRLVAGELMVGDRLDALDTGDPSSQLRAVFSWSYATLTPGTARLFRLLGSHAGVDIGVAAAASLTAQPEAAVRAMLLELVRANLLAEPRPGRYSFHDLLREYAVDRGDHEDPPATREDARHRLCDHYVDAADEAVRLLGVNPTVAERPRAAAPVWGPAHGPVDAAGAREWLAVEHLNLLSTIDSALRSADGRVEHAFFLLETLAPYLLPRGHAAEWAPLAVRGVEVARLTGNREAEAGLRRQLTRWCAMRGALDVAEEHARAAVDLSASAGDDTGWAWAMQSLAIVHQIRGDYAAALAAGRAAVAAFTAAGNVAGRVSMLGNLGAMHQERGEPRAAEPFLVEGLKLATSHGLDLSAASIGHNLANVRIDLGRAAEAIDLLKAALEYGRRSGDVILRINVLGSLGVALRMTGRLAEAAGYAETQVAYADRQDDLSMLAAAYRDRGAIRAELGDLSGAIADLTVALERAEESGEAGSRIQALTRMAQVRVAAGDPWAATGPAERARDQARAAGMAVLEAGALLALAAATADVDPRRAVDHAREALAVAPAGHRHLEAVAREALGRALARIGRDADASREQETAAAIHRALGTCPLSLIY